MNYTRAVSLLGLQNRHFSSRELRQAYLKRSLQYHPDKNKDGADMFREVNEAYTFLTKVTDNERETTSDKTSNTTTAETSFSGMLQTYIKGICDSHNMKEDVVYDVLFNMLNTTTDYSVDVLRKLPKEYAKFIRTTVTRYNGIFNLNMDVYKRVIDSLSYAIHKEDVSENHTETSGCASVSASASGSSPEQHQYVQNVDTSNNVVSIYPTLKDMITANVFKLEHGKDIFYVPLWHTDIEYKSGLRVELFPSLPDNIQFDADNNICISITEKVTDVLYRGFIEISICEGVTHRISSENLKITKSQLYILRELGIPDVNEDDVFDTSRKTHIYVHIDLLA